MRRTATLPLISLCTVLVLALFFLHCGSNSSTPPCLTCSTGGQNHYVFTANAAGNPSTVSALTSNATTGAIASISGSPFSTGSGSVALAKSPAKGYLYVANSSSGDISAFTISATTGALTAIAGSPFAAEAGVNALAVEATGHFLYAVSRNSANLWTFSISATGALSPVSGTPTLITTQPGAASNSVVIDPAGHYLYAATGASFPTVLYGFSLDSTTGALTPLGFNPVLYGLANKAAFDPAGKVLLVTGTNVYGTAGGVEVFMFNSSTGGLVLGLASPIQVGVDPAGAAVDGTGKYVYVANTSDATIHGFSLDTTSGALQAVAGAPFPSGGNGNINGPLGIAADATGKFLFVCNASNDISVFSINSSTGTLTAIAGSPFPDGGNAPSAIIFVP